MASAFITVAIDNLLFPETKRKPSNTSSTSSYSNMSVPRDKSPASSSDEEHPGSTPPNPVTQTLGVYKVSSGVDFEIRQAGSAGTTAFFVVNSTFTPGTPDVQVMRGGKDGPLVASAKFHKLSGNIELALGDAKTDDVPSEHMKKQSIIVHKEYTFETDMGEDGKRHKFTWKRTLGKGLHSNYTCEDSTTGEMVAYFAKTGGKSLRKVGKLCYTLQSSTEELDLMILLSWLAMRERQVRSEWYSAGIAGGS